MLYVSIDQIKSIKDVPVAVGFGVSKPEHYRSLCAFSDGVIIGSHFVNLIASHMPDQDKALMMLRKRIREFKSS